MKMVNISAAEELDILTLLESPVQYRCHRFYLYINGSTVGDLQRIFLPLIDSIFNAKGGEGWGLRSIMQQNNPQDFQQLVDFFGPLGPIFRMCYRLLEDHYIKFDLPVSLLPHQIRIKLTLGDDLPAFYKDSLIYGPTGMVLQLNAFDYYIFQFCLHLLHPINERTDFRNAFGRQYSVYRVLCSDYLQHFLPKDLNTNVLPFLTNHREKLVKLSSLPTRNVRSPRLIRVTEDLTPPSPIIPNSQEHWRTETVILVFTDVWLCSDYSISIKPTLDFSLEIPQTALPSIEYINIIRMMVKQFHSFTLSGNIDNSTFAELKHNCWKLFQDKMYLFIRQMVNRWPLDHNFISVIELWLSFIQPWRYHPNRNLLEQTLDDSGLTRGYLPYVIDNLMAYTQIFIQVFERFERMDLGISRSSYMLYRVMKVFSQTMLPALLFEIELSLNKVPSPLSSPAVSSSGSSRNVSFTQYDINNSHLLSSTTSSHIKSKIMKLEGINYVYQNLFSEQMIIQVTRLIKHIQECILQSQGVLRSLEQEQEIQNKGFWNKFQNFFLDNPIISTLEDTIIEKRKVPGYLDLSTKHLCEIFNLKQDILVSRIHQQIQSCSGVSQTLNSSSDSSTVGEDGLTQSMNCSQMKSFAKNIKYMGDPDLLPVSDLEISFLVRLFLRLSKTINELCAEEFQILWRSDSLLGKIARQILQPPMIAKSFDKSRPGRSLRETHLPPRLSLRPLAQIRRWLNLGFLIIVGSIFKFSIPFTIFTIFTFYVLIIVFRAVMYDHFDETEPEELQQPCPRIRLTF